MKFYKYSLIAALALSGAMFSCSDDDDYAPGKPVSGDEVYFPISESATVDIPTDATEVSVTVCRLNDAAEITVPVAATVTDDKGTPVTGVFTVPAQVTFPAGANETKLTIAIDFAKVEPDIDYLVNLKLEGDNTTPYGASERTYTLLYSPWSEWEYIEGKEATYIMSVYASGEEEVPMLTRKSLIDPNRVEYAVCDLFYENEKDDDGKQEPLINIVYSMNLTNTVEIDGVECPRISVSTLQLDENGAGTGNYFVLYDLRTWAVEIFGVAEENVDAWMERNNFGPSHYNPETGTFVIDYILIGTALSPGQYYDMGYDYVQLPGFKSYFINFDYSGNYVNTAEDVEYAVVSAVKSDDVNSYKYDIFAGQLNEASLEAAYEDVKASEDVPVVTLPSTNLAFALEEDGLYTIVAVGLDAEGTEICKSSYVFDYATVQGAPKWQSLGTVEYTDGFICSLFNVPALSFDVELQQSTEEAYVYRLVDPYKQWAEYTKFTYGAGKYYLEFVEYDDNQYYVPQCELGVTVNSEYGMMFGTSVAYLNLAKGNDATGLFGSIEDGLLKFPTGQLLVTAENLQSWYYANIDPENPTGPEEDGGNGTPYDRTWGEGTFCIDFGTSTEAAASKANRLPAKSDFAFDNKLKAFESSFKLNLPKKAKVTSNDIKEYRLANPQTLR